MNIDNLRPHVPKQVMDELPMVMLRFKINTPLRLAHFLSQCAHESWNFKATVESLNYSSDSLLKVFKKYFPTKEIADKYARNPEKIANIVYSSRMGNGPAESGEGWKYRGRGYIQLTGKVNYAAFDKFVEDDILSSPELVANKYPLLSAAWFWNSRNLNAFADLGDSVENITVVTKKINGGINGLQDRINKFRFFYGVLQ